MLRRKTRTAAVFPGRRCFEAICGESYDVEREGTSVDMRERCRMHAQPRSAMLVVSCH